MAQKIKLTGKEKAALHRFQREVCERAGDVDPGGELHWESLAIGFFVGVGLSVDESHRCYLEASRNNFWS